MIQVLNILTDSNVGGAGRCLINYLKYCDRSRYAVKVVLPRHSACGMRSWNWMFR